MMNTDQRYDPAAALGGGRRGQNQGSEQIRRVEDALMIHLKSENPNIINFEELFQENLP